MQSQSLLGALVQHKHWHSYATFIREYRAAAERVAIPNSPGPSRTQLYRWTCGSLQRRPHSDHCRVLEAMFPGRSVDQLLSEHDSARPIPPPDLLPPSQTRAEAVASAALRGVRAAYASRSQFMAERPPHRLLDGADTVDAAGLSLNVICQQYPGSQLAARLSAGMTMRCLFLDPDGEAIKRRDVEEGHRPGTLSTLTALNIDVLQRIRDGLDQSARERLSIATCDETIRFNMLLVDGRTGIVQPYLPHARGVESPTFVVEQDGGGMFDVFAHVFSAMWQRATVR